jgi:hypothetical protein
MTSHRHALFSVAQVRRRQQTTPPAPADSTGSNGAASSGQQYSGSPWLSDCSSGPVQVACFERCEACDRPLHTRPGESVFERYLTPDGELLHDECRDWHETDHDAHSRAHGPEVLG